MVIIFLGDIELIWFLTWYFQLIYIPYSEIDVISFVIFFIMHFAFPLLKINPLLLTFRWVNIPLTLYVLIVVTHSIPDWFIVNHYYYETW